MGLMTWRYKKDLLKAVLIWLLVAVSIGWYYVFTYYGRTGIPIPLPEPCAALILYYFSVLNASTKLQAAHWLVAFPVAGLLWVGALTVTAPFFGGRHEHFGWAAGRLSRTLLPLLIPMPVVAYLAGAEFGGFSFSQMMSVALREAGAPAPWWLTWVYLGTAVWALLWQFSTYKRVFDLQGKKAGLHLAASAIALILVAAGIGAVVAYPLRQLFEPAWIGVGRTG